MKSKPKKSKKANIWPKLPVLLSIILLFIAAISLGRQIPRQKTEAGQLGEAQTYGGENLRNSLDLRLAAKADYPSSPLSLVKDLGTDGGLKRQIISFGVPVDGLTEYGLLIMPDSGRPPSGFPALILLHGYLNPEEYSTTAGYISDMEFYARQGFVVVKPDFRGQGLSLGQGVAEGAYFSMAYNTDVMSLISALKDTEYIDSANLNLWGHSMGAYVAMRAAVISKDIKNTILLSDPSGSLKDIYLSYMPPSDLNNPAALRQRNNVFAKYGTPPENSQFWINTSTDSQLGRLSSNVQIHVGALDSIIPPQLSAKLDAALTAANKPHQYYVYPDGGHGLIFERPVIWERSLAVLKPGASGAGL